MRRRLSVVQLRHRPLTPASRYYSFHGTESDDDAAFETRMDSLCREIGSRGQQKRKLPEAVPPARVSLLTSPVPSPDCATSLASAPISLASKVAPKTAPEASTLAPSPATPTPTPNSAAPELHQSFSPRAALTSTVPPQQQSTTRLSATASCSFAEMVSFMREERAAVKADRAEMEAKIEELTTSQEVVSAAQVSALTARLGTLHSTQALSDDELFAVEDCIADFLEIKANVGVVTMGVVTTNHAMGKVHKMIALSEGMVDDAMFARQLRRKFA